MKLRSPDSSYRFALRLLSPACFLLALLSKPSAVTLPLAILLLEWLFFKREFLPALLRLAPWFCLSLITVLVSQLSQSSKIPITFDIWRQTGAALEASGFYLIKLLFPINLSADYGFSIDGVFENNKFLMLWILPLSLPVFYFRHVREFIIPLLLLLIFLLPVLGFIPFSFQSISIVADRYMYMSIFGISMGVTFFLEKAAPLARLPLLIVLICFALLGAFSSGRWKTPFELFNRTILVNQGSYISYNNLGVYFLKRGDYSGAAHYFKEALKVKPGFFLSTFNLANSYANLNQLERAEELYREALKVNPDHLQANYNLGVVYIKNANPTDAVRQLKKVVSIDTTYAPAYIDLGSLLEARQDYNGAAEMYKRALKADHSLTEAYLKLGKLYSALGEYDTSLFFQEKALDLDPENIELTEKVKYLRNSR